MRHKRFLSSAGDPCSHRAHQSRQTPRAKVAHSNVAGPSRLPSSSSAPSSSPSPSPPPPPPPPPIHSQPLPSPPSISPSPSTAAPTTPFAYVSTSQTLPPLPSLCSSKGKRHSFFRDAILPQTTSHHLSFLYPPSCLHLAHGSSSAASIPIRTTRSKSSLAPTSAVSAAAQQLATAHDDRNHQQHVTNHDPAEFTFLRHHYDPPHRLIHHPRSNSLLHHDAKSHLDEEETLPQLPVQDVPPTSTQTHDHLKASVAALASLRHQSFALRQSLQATKPIKPDTLVTKCRRLVLQSGRIKSRLHARAARAIAYQTVSDCSLHLLASGQSVLAANIVRHLLVKLGWNPRSVSDFELPLPSDSATPVADGSSSNVAAVATARPTAGTRLVLITQQVISLLTLAPSTTSPRPTRRFQSQQHLDVATSLVSAMHLAQMPRATASQTALIRAMIASGQAQLAVQTFAAEVRAWWAAHKEARRLRSPMRHQAALVVEIGKPSSQALREVTRALQHLEELLARIRPDLLAELPQRERQALSAKRSEYADALVDLIRLVRGGRLPLPPTPSTPEITWILSACCRFESTVLLNEPIANNAAVPGSFDVAEKRRMQGAAEMIRYYLREYMQSLPDGQTRSAGNLLFGGNPVIRPTLGIVVYNQLIHYALSVLKSPAICKEVFEHMTRLRQPPLEPDPVTFNTILRQATTQRYQGLARAVLITKQPQNDAPQQPISQESVLVDQSSSSKGKATTAASLSPEAAAEAAEAAAASGVEPPPIRPMIQQIDTAIANADPYRLVSLLQYVTASGLFLRRYRQEPGHAGVKELVMRIYPALNTARFARRPTADSLSPPDPLQQQMSDRRLRPKANQASRHAILNPHVLTATLNLAAKAGKTGLALRIWRLIKRTSLQSALQSPTNDVAKTPWKVPVEAATILMQVLANEAARMPKVKHALPSRRLRPSLSASRFTTRRTTQSMAHREYARGWNIVASLRGRSYIGRLRSVGRSFNGAGDLGEGLRWRAAQLLAKREYAFLVHHWQLSQRLSNWRRKRLEGWMQPGGQSEAKMVSPKRAVLGLVGENADLQPDSRFYDALLDVFGRRPGMVQRSRRHLTRSEVLSQLRRGYVQAVERQSSSSREESVSAIADSGDTAGRSERATSPDMDRHNTASPLQSTATPASDHLSPILPPLQTLTTSQLLHMAVSRITTNSRGRSTSHPPLDPFLLHLVLDMEALALDIPVGYRWILAHCSLAAQGPRGLWAGAVPELLQNDQPRRSRNVAGAFSPFRGARVKSVGLVARRPNTAAAVKEAQS